MGYSKFQGKEYNKITDKISYSFFLEADRIALGRRKIKTLSVDHLRSVLIVDHVWKFQKLLRKLEYNQNCKNDLLSKLYKVVLSYKYHRLSTKLGFSISINTFGAGLSIAHVGPIIINKGVKIGANCRINSCVNIGTQAGYSNKAPHIGDNVYIAPGAKIFGEITIANNIAIGANSVVNKSFNEENIAIAGIPAKKIKNIEIDSILIKATDLLNNNLYNDSMAGLPASEIKTKLK